MQTQAGTESELCGKCQSQVAREDEEVFVLLAERMTKKQGKWSMVTGRLFPGYVFVETGRIEDFYKRLKGTGWTARILRTGEEITPVYPEEEAYLKQLGGREHIVRYSEGYIEGDKLTVTSGAMKGCQGGALKGRTSHKSEKNTSSQKAGGNGDPADGEAGGSDGGDGDCLPCGSRQGGTGGRKQLPAQETP